MNTLERLEKLWKQHQESNVVFRFPIRKEKTEDGNVVTHYAHAVIQSFSNRRDMSNTVIPQGAKPSVFDYRVTLFTYDKSGAPVQYKPIYVPENFIISPAGTLSKDQGMLRYLVSHLRERLKEGLPREASLLPALSNEEMDIIFDSGYYNGRMAIDGQTITPEQQAEIGDDPIDFLEKGHFGTQSVARFIEKINTIQSRDRMEKRKGYLPKGYLDGINPGYPINPRETRQYLNNIDQLQKNEEGRILTGLSNFIFNLDFDLVEKLRQVQGATPDGYVYFKTDFAKEMTSKDGSSFKVYPRREFLENYPLMVNMVGKNTAYQHAVDSMKNIAPLINQTLSQRGDDETQVGKKLLRRIARKNIITSQTGEEFLQSLAAIPSDSFPKEVPDNFISESEKPYIERTEWDNMEACVACVNEIAKATGLQREKLFSDVKGDWADYRKRLAKAASNTRIPQGMTEELFQEIMGLLPIKEWDKNPDKDAVRHEIDHYLEKVITPILPGDVLAADVDVWLKAHNAPDDRIETLRQAGREVGDILNTFTSKVSLPLATYISGMGDAVLTPESALSAQQVTRDILFSTPRSSIHLIKASQDFHTNLDDFLNAGIKEEKKTMRTMGEISSDAMQRTVEKDEMRNELNLTNYFDWMPLIAETIEAKDGFKLVPLLSSDDLKLEGQVMSHCVGTYTSNCKTGNSRIFTIVDENYDRVTTLELIMDLDKESVSINQNQSHGNGSSDVSRQNREKIDKAGKIAKWFMNSINDGLIQCEWSAVSEYKKDIKSARSSKRKRNKDMFFTIKDECGFTPSDLSSLRQSKAAWNRFIEKKYQKTPIRGFEDIKSVRDTARILNIDYKSDFDKKDNEDELKENGINISWLNKAPSLSM